MTPHRRLIASTLLCACLAFGEKKKLFQKDPGPSPLDLYIKQAHATAQDDSGQSPGSIFTGPALLADLATDVKARYVNDIVTIVVNENASAVTTGVTKTQRASSANASLTSAAGKLSIPARLSNIVTANGNQQLDGQGTTSRTNTLTTTLSARVVDVLPNGYLVVEGSRTILVNSENQVVTLRGVVRPNDLTNFNTVNSSAIGQMELKIDGKGVVNDMIRRPNIIYRILLGILPF